jgi:hypothetical protein
MTMMKPPDGDCETTALGIAPHRFGVLDWENIGSRHSEPFWSVAALVIFLN